MNTMVDNLENAYQVRTAMYVDVEKEESWVEGVGPSKRTRENLKRKAN